MKSQTQPIALVIGLCSHGLAMARALHEAGAEVHAFEAKDYLPGALTNAAEVHLVSSIKTDSLIDDLARFRASIPKEKNIILFPTNDNNVKVVGKHIDTLEKDFVLSWAHCADKVLGLLLKNNIEERCKETGLNYPQSFVLEKASQIEQVIEQFEFPIIAKPVQPQSGFKAIRCDDVEALQRLVTRFEDDLPFLIQHWITGTDKDIFFGALYLDKGKVVASFTGNKLESFPPAMGQTTVAVTSDNPDVLPLTETFFDGLEMSGPVSLELKRDEKGRYWVIEPTIGRTDFWLGLCVAAGCNLLEYEYQHTTGQDYSPASDVKPVIWFDSERDVTAFFRHLSKSLPFSANRLSPSFSYLKRGDLGPFWRAFRQAGENVSKSVFRRLVGSKVPDIEIQGEVKVFNDLKSMSPCAHALLEKASDSNIFVGKNWYENFCEQVASKGGEIQFLCLFKEDNKCIAVLPMWLTWQHHFGVRFNYLSSLTNYYSPVFDIACDTDRITVQDAYLCFFGYLAKTAKSWDLIDLRPLYPQTCQAVTDAAQAFQLHTHEYYVTKNWYERVDETFEEYYGRLPSRTKNTIKRKSAKLTKTAEWEIKVYTKPEDVDVAVRHYQEVYQESWKPGEPYPQFMLGLARMASQRGWMRLGVLYVNKEPIAAQFWLHGNDAAYIYKLAYKESTRQYSPGTILTAHMMKNAVELEGVKVIDFLTGRDEFKKEWMHEARDLLGVQIDNHKNLKSFVLGLKNSLSDTRDRLSEFIKR